MGKVCISISLLVSLVFLSSKSLDCGIRVEMNFVV